MFSLAVHLLELLAMGTTTALLDQAPLHHHGARRRRPAPAGEAMWEPARLVAGTSNWEAATGIP